MIFSIVIPVYNVEKYLRECLESVLKQTFSDYEVILIDDGSTDSSGNICDEYVEKYNNFKVYHKKNEGLLKTRLFGRDKAQGTYFVSIDSDDFISEKALEVLYNYIKKYDYPDVICFQMNKFTQDSKIIAPHQRIEEVFNENNKSEFYKRVISSFEYNNMCSKIVKMQLFKSDNTDFSVFCKNQGEDLALSLYSLTYAKTIVSVDDRLYFYRWNSNSITNKKITLRNIEDYNLKNLYEKELEYFHIWNINDKTNTTILKRRSIEYAVTIFCIALCNTNSKSEYEECLNYDWNKCFINNNEIDKYVINSLNFKYRFVYWQIKNKNRFFIRLIYTLFKKKFKRG